MIAGPIYEHERSQRLADSTQNGRHEVVRRHSSNTARCEAALSLGLLQLNAVRFNAFATYNSRYPQDRNNGAAWAGRGFSASLETGLEFQIGRLRVGVLPQAAYQENLGVRIAEQNQPGYSAFVSSGHPTSIDMPQRFGREPYWLFDPGQSYVRVDYGHAAVGVSTENLWVGPTQRAPILLSASASGFPHAFFSLERAPFWGGRWSADLFLGRLDESDYFDGESDNDLRWLHGVTLVFEPRAAAGLALGVGRMYTSAAHGRSAFAGLTRAYGLSGGPTRTIDDNSMIAFFARYAVPGADAEVYGEWGREAGIVSLRELINEPDQSMGYALGLQKMIRFGPRAVRVYGELTHLDAAAPGRAGRGILTFYTHGSITQGHTQRGQSLGAWTGPGSNLETVGAEYLTPASSIGFYIEHVRFNADAYYNQWAKYYAWLGQDAQLGAGVVASYRLRNLMVTLDTNLANRYNRAFLELDGAMPGNFTREQNLRAEVAVFWNPMPGIRR